MEEKQQHGRWKYLMCIWFGIFCFPLIAIAAQGVIKVKGYFSEVQAIRQIEKNSNYVFFYDAADLDEVKRKNIDCQGTIEKVLSVVFEGSNVNYLVRGDEVVLKVNKQSVQQKGEKRVVTGVVTDAIDGEPLVGVNIVVKGQKSGTITDLNGRYSISVSGDKAVLVFSYIGYQKREAPVEDLGVVNVTMSGEQQTLNEVVVVGSGVQKKVSVTGAITNVKGDILRMPTSQLSTSFAGKLAGVIATTKTGEPGSGADFYIRGISTFGGRTTPLILLDDVEISVADLNYVPAENIESFSILKDASATAIYGARGANGVMIISTKGGDYNMKTKVNVSAENSFNIMSDFPEFVDGPRYMELYNEADLSRNPNKSKDQLLYSDRRIQLTRDGVNPYVYPNVDWQDVIFKKMTMTQRANINVSGGGTKVKYYMSLNVSHDSGLLNTEKAYSWNNNINIMNYTFQNNISYKLTPTTTIRMNMNAQIRQNKGPNINSADLFKMILTTTPVTFPATYPAQPGDTYIRYGSDYQSSDYLYPNPYAQMMTSYKEQNANTLNTVIKVEQDFGFVTKGLKANIWVNFKNWSSSSYNRSITPYLFRAVGYSEDSPLEYDLERIQEGADYIAQSDIARSSDQTFEFQGNISYNRQFGLHNVGGMLMYRQREYRSDVLPNRNQGVSGRFTYDYGQRYLAEINFGYNGTERLAKKKRFGFFPAVGLAYYISNESFYPEVIKKYVPKLKLRASVGRAGNDNTGGTRFLYRPTYKMDAGGFTQGYNDTGGGLNGIGNGIIEGRFAAPYLGWEVEDKQNYGFDIGLFDNRLEVIFDYFDSTRSQILLQRQTVPQLGGLRDDPWQNFGKVRNRGVDMSVNAHQNIGKVKLSARGTFTFTRNKILEYDELPPKYDYQAITGKRVSDKDNLYYIAERLYTEDDFTVSTNANGLKTYKLRSEIPQPTLGGLLGPGDIKYTDVNGDGIIDSYDRVRGIGHPETPEIIYGFGLNAEYKGIYASIFFQGAGNTSVLLGGKTSEGWYPFSWGVDQSNYRTFALNRWTENNPSQDVIIPRLHKSNANNANNRVASTWWLRDGSFLRLKNIEIGYQIPKKFLSKIGFEAARIYLMGYNLAVWDHIKYFDPEAGNANAGLNYPLPRTYTIGLDFTF